MLRTRHSAKLLCSVNQLSFIRHASALTTSKLHNQPTVNSSNIHALKVINPDSGMPTTISPLFNPNIAGRLPPEPNRPEIEVPRDRGFFADPEKKALLSVAEPVDWTISVGTELKGCQLSQLNHKQLDELALLVAERGVVFLRDQDITPDQQAAMFEYFAKYFTLPSMNEIHIRSDLNHTPWEGVDWHADTSFEINHETMCDMWGQTPNRPPMDSHHPAVITHPVTGLKALNVNIGWCDGFAELNRAESDALLNFLKYHIHSADDHYVRMKWQPGSVAIWDNRYDQMTNRVLLPLTTYSAVLHRIIPTKYRGPPRTGVRTVTKGSKPTFDPNSLGRQEKEELDMIKE
ncbi:hypothetical protein G7Y89_g12 [Cudoniella acicularis]|uniref:TauD/TfdA-like domain-containing protein n=1 Tax=Cudoniella acicularis TaxID=354080 RepID=A0A8H4W9A8_9HELO|nr:hypothetical protein G7Y89_g12 [Cudoniella acicularis]